MKNKEKEQENEIAKEIKKTRDYALVAGISYLLYNL